MQNYFKSGSWNCICMLCGVQFKAEDMLKRWDGMLVCKKDWEPRHSLDFLRATPERGTVPFTAPEPTDQFVVVPYLQIVQGIAGVGVSGYAISGYDNPIL